MKLILSGLGLLLTCCAASANPYLLTGHPMPCQSCGPVTPYHGGYDPYCGGCGPMMAPQYPMPWQIANPAYSLGPGGLPFNGILPPMPWGGPSPQQQGPAFSTHPYARSPRDYFMISDIQEDLRQRGY